MDEVSVSEVASAPSVDEPYTWGRPLSSYLSLRQETRLVLLKSRRDVEERRMVVRNGEVVS